MKNPKAMYALSYGLFVLTARQGEKDNGCIINTAMQVTTEPNRIIITVNKSNYTHDMVLQTGRFSLSVLSQKAEFSTFQRFGFQSGRDVDKFAGFEQHAVRGENGIYPGHQRLAVLQGGVHPGPGHPHPVPGRRGGRRPAVRRSQHHLYLLSGQH